MQVHLLFVLGCLAMRANALTYWIDSSCSGKLGEPTLDETRLMASEGNARLQNSDDEIMADAFLKIFKMDKANIAAITTATTAFQKISAMAPTGSFEDSDVRIYCDNDQRWKLVPDLATTSKKNKNSKKAPDLQSWYDPINFVYRKPGGYGCIDAGTLAQTYYTKDPKKSDKGVKAGQNPGREVITICDFAFNSEVHIFSDTPAGTDMSTLVLSDMEEMESITLLHEMCHLRSTIAIPGNNDEAVGWEKVINLPVERTLTEPDTFAFLGFTALLNRNNVRLSADDAKAKEGVLEWIIQPTQPASASSRMRALKFFA